MSKKKSKLRKAADLLKVDYLLLESYGREIRRELDGEVLSRMPKQQINNPAIFFSFQTGPALTVDEITAVINKTVIPVFTEIFESRGGVDVITEEERQALVVIVMAFYNGDTFDIAECRVRDIMLRYSHDSRKRKLFFEKISSTVNSSDSTWKVDHDDCEA